MWCWLRSAKNGLGSPVTSATTRARTGLGSKLINPMNLARDVENTWGNPLADLDAASHGRIDWGDFVSICADLPRFCFGGFNESGP